MAKRQITRIWVYLADNEYGNDLMKQVADEVFAAHPDDELMVSVHEHGGWHLTYIRVNGQVVIGESANDQAAFGEAVREYRRVLNEAEQQGEIDWKYLPEIRRQAV